MYDPFADSTNQTLFLAAVGFSRAHPCSSAPQCEGLYAARDYQSTDSGSSPAVSSTSRCSSVPSGRTTHSELTCSGTKLEDSEFPGSGSGPGRSRRKTMNELSGDHFGQK